MLLITIAVPMAAQSEMLPNIIVILMVKKLQICCPSPWTDPTSSSTSTLGQVVGPA